jgi:colanic acid biosynthesis glycosyl transferase WcaI
MMATASELRLRLAFVEQFYYPEGWGGAELPRDLTVHLARAGFDVEVICGSDQYAPVDGDPGPNPEEAGVRVRRVGLALGGDIRRHKLLRQLLFYAGLALRLLLRAPPDLFVTQTNPPLAVPLVALAAAVWRRPYLIIAMDIYPEVLVAHGAVGRDSPLARVLTGLFGWAYRSATRVVALGPVMGGRLGLKGVASDRLVEISNWSTGAPGLVRGESSALAREWGLVGKFVLVYSGNLGIGHEFDTLLQGFAQALRRNPDLRLVIIGKGSRLEEVRRLSVSLQLGDAVQFAGFVPAARLPESLGLADLAVVTLRPGFEGLIVPSKLLGYLARGVPVLYVGPDSDVARLVTRFECGYAVANGDAAGVCDSVLDARSDLAALAAKGEAGRVGYEARLSRALGVARYTETIRDCLTDDARRSGT